MAAGDSKLFNDFVKKGREGRYTITDTYALYFLSNTYASIDTNTADPSLSNYTQTSGGNFTAGYTLNNYSVTRSTNLISVSADNIGSISKDPANPIDVRSAIIICTTKGNEAIQVFDMTTDGTTPVDVINNDFNFTFGASGLNTSTNLST